MKKIFLVILLMFSIIKFSFAQDDNNTRAATPEEQKEILNNIDSTKMLAEISTLACKCIDSISLTNKDNKEVFQDIKKCIDKEVTAYALEMKLFSSLKNLSKKITINIDENPNSDENKRYYYDIERWLRDSCTSLKNAVRADNKESDFSISDNPEAMEQYNKGVAFVNKENYSDAISYFKKAVKLDPRFAFAWDNLGLCYRKTNDFDKALEAYNKSLRIDPRGHMPLENIPIVYEFKKDYDKEIQAYQNLVAVYSDDPETFYGMGRVYTYFKNDLEKGLDNMCKAYNLYVQINSPYRTDAEKNIQYIYQQMKKDNKEDVFNKILKDNNISTDK